MEPIRCFTCDIIIAHREKGLKDKRIVMKRAKRQKTMPIPIGNIIICPLRTYSPEGVERAKRKREPVSVMIVSENPKQRGGHGSGLVNLLA